MHRGEQAGARLHTWTPGTWTQSQTLLSLSPRAAAWPGKEGSTASQSRWPQPLTIWVSWDSAPCLPLSHREDVLGPRPQATVL